MQDLVRMVSDNGTLDISGAGGTERLKSLSGGGAVALGGNDLALTNAGGTFSGTIGGTGGVTLDGGTEAFSGANTYSGGTTVSGGTVSVSADNNLGDPAGGLTLNGGTLKVTGTSYRTTARSVALGSKGGAFDIADMNNVLSLTQPLSGGGSLTKTGDRILLLRGTNTYKGGTQVKGGTLQLGDYTHSADITGPAQVASGATLSGAGNIDGPVTVAGTLAPSGKPAPLSMNRLTLKKGSDTRFKLGTPGVVGGITNSLVTVKGDLQLGGTLNAEVASAGYYQLFKDGGKLSGAFEAENVSSSSPNFAVAKTKLSPASGHVNLTTLGAGQNVAFWDGKQFQGNSRVDGGAGTWTASATNWTGEPGHASVNGDWNQSVGIFLGTGGEVAVDGTQTFDTLQFKSDGYRLTGGGLNISPATGTAGTINVDGGVNTTIASAFSGSGSLNKVGPGTLTLTSDHNAYKGGTTVSAGTLIGDSKSLQGDICDNAVLGFHQTVDGTYNGHISGTGSVAKTGAATLILNNVNTYSGVTTVGAGSLIVGGDVEHSSAAITGPVMVAPGARLGGHGRVGNLVSAGTVAPGNSIGTLTVNGNYTARATTVYQVEVNPQGDADRLDVQGRAKIQGGKVEVLAQQGDYAPQTNYTILSAKQGRQGQFDQVTSNLAFLDPMLSYTPNTVGLTFTRNDIDFTTAAGTANQRAAAGAVAPLGFGNTLYDAVGPDRCPRRSAGFRRALGRGLCQRTERVAER